MKKSINISFNVIWNEAYEDLFQKREVISEETGGKCNTWLDLFSYSQTKEFVSSLYRYYNTFGKPPVESVRFQEVPGGGTYFVSETWYYKALEKNILVTHEVTVHGNMDKCEQIIELTFKDFEREQIPLAIFIAKEFVKQKDIAVFDCYVEFLEIESGGGRFNREELY